MFRFLTLLVIVPLAACVADPNRDADARAPDDARTDAQTDESPPPRQLAGVAKPLFVAPAPHPAVTLANLAQPQTTAIVKAALDEAREHFAAEFKREFGDDDEGTAGVPAKP